VPTLGGLSKKVLSNVDTAVTFSPDGKNLAFMRGDLAHFEETLIVASVDGSGERSLVKRKTKFIAQTTPSWSPDGKAIACAFTDFYDDGQFTDVLEVAVEDGKETRMSSHKWIDVRGTAWLASGDKLVIAAAGKREATNFSHQLWLVSKGNEDAQPITNDLNDYGSLSITADSSALVSGQRELVSSIWKASVVQPNQAIQITSGKYDGAAGLSWTPDNRIVYASYLTGNIDTWIVDPDGTNQNQLTDDAAMDLNPSVSPDNRYIVLASNRARTTNIWRTNLDGSNPVQLTRGQSESAPRCSPDGKWVVYLSTASGTPTVWKAPIDGGSPAQLTDKLSGPPVVSPDGKLIACYYTYTAGETGLLTSKLAIIPFEGGEPIKTFDLPPTVTWNIIHWTADGRSLIYTDNRNGVSNIWAQPIDGGLPKQLTLFGSDQIFDFDLSRDGKQLALARGKLTSDVVLISGFR
jgi:Tol biopolymer transport system component